MAGTGAEDNDIACVELEHTALLSSEADFGDAPRAIPIVLMGSVNGSAGSRTSRHAAITPSVTRKEYSRTGCLAASLPAPELSDEAVARFSLPREQTASTARFRLCTIVFHQVSKFVSLLSQSWTLLKGAVRQQRCCVDVWGGRIGEEQS
jgi:hypothetical protein